MPSGGQEDLRLWEIAPAGLLTRPWAAQRERASGAEKKEGDFLPLLKGQPWKMSHRELSCLSFLPPAWKRKG